FSAGKDTTTGHWELAGLTLERPFPTYPEGFPPEVIDAFRAAVGRGVLCNRPASGTAIIEELGEQHMQTGDLIVYTSADSVFQIAAHEDVVPPAELYEICRKARAILQGEHAVGRVIARPFVGEPGQFVRTGNRRDFSLEPIGPTVLDDLTAAGIPTAGVGKIEDIFALRGLSHSDHAAGNPACMEATFRFLKELDQGFLFVNLVDFDSQYGHRNDPAGYGAALEAFDAQLPALLDALRDDDLLILTADHGCDPTTPSTDHSREYVPLLIYSKRNKAGVPLGTLPAYTAVAATVADYFGLKQRYGAESQLPKVLGQG
ncbi:MAG: phosphopentomutase, partial [Clostridia bacterium]|nr:phosphopentomutase [Clostridia bacterium]